MEERKKTLEVNPVSPNRQQVLSLETLGRCVGPPDPLRGRECRSKGHPHRPQLDSSTVTEGAKGPEGPGSKIHLKVNQPIDQAFNQSNLIFFCRAFSLISSHPSTKCMHL